MNCCFIGHGSNIKDGVYEKILSEVSALVELGVTNFLCGGYGDFDKLCIRAVGEVKLTHSQIHNYIILAYNTQSQINRYKYEIANYGAEPIFPFKDELNSRSAISIRNQFMIDKSNFCIAYVYNNFGGAFKSFDYAMSKNKEIINLAYKTIS